MVEQEEITGCPYLGAFAEEDEEDGDAVLEGSAIGGGVEDHVGVELDVPVVAADGEGAGFYDETAVHVLVHAEPGDVERVPALLRHSRAHGPCRAVCRHFEF